MTDRLSHREKERPMSHRSRPRTFHKPKRPAPDLPLEELFYDDDRLSLKLMTAEYRICHVFAHATDWINGKQRGTDNFIVGVDRRQKDLVNHIFDQVAGTIVYVSELPRLENETATSLRFVARNAERRLLAVQLSIMVRRCAIWFDEQPPGTWNIVPSVMDMYYHNKDRAAEAYHVEQQQRREALHGGGRIRQVHGSRAMALR